MNETNMSPANLIERLQWRYAAKKFDPTKTLSSEQWHAIEEALVLSPSSYGLQPWKFIVPKNPELRKKLRVASWNQSQVEDASHYVVFLAKNDVSEMDIDRHVDRLVEVRGVTRESLERMKATIMGDVVLGGKQNWMKEWTSRQTYIALGQAMAAAAMIGVDTCPMEGLEPETYDQILGLGGSGYRTVCALAVGFRHPEDRLATAKKVRFKTSDVVEYRM
jgi:nitroreductase